MKNLMLGCGLLLLTSVVWAMQAPPEVNLEIKVIDEQGAAIAGARVEVEYPGRIPENGAVFRKLTDEDGYASFSGSSFLALRIKAEREGCYVSYQEVATAERVGKKNIYSDREVELVLRQIKNPVPMYAYRIDTQMEDTTIPKGFDLIKNDWVAPWGRGETTDIEISITGFYHNKYNYDSTLHIEFPNKGDGIVAFEAIRESQFKSPYEAVEENYLSAKKWHKSRYPNPDDPMQHTIIETARYDAGYVIRIRTRFDKCGGIVSAQYGKIYGDFSFGGATEEVSYLKSGFIYLNPKPNDRNLEFDLKRNLMKELSFSNQPKDP
jgi:hypothetical protein